MEKVGRIRSSVCTPTFSYAKIYVEVKDSCSMSFALRIILRHALKISVGSLTGVVSSTSKALGIGRWASFRAVWSAWERSYRVVRLFGRGWKYNGKCQISGHILPSLEPLTSSRGRTIFIYANTLKGQVHSHFRFHLKLLFSFSQLKDGTFISIEQRDAVDSEERPSESL